LERRAIGAAIWALGLAVAVLLVWWAVIAFPDAGGVVLPQGSALFIVFTAVALMA
jgi:hypothetical protein